MKRYLVIVGDQYYPSGGTGDWVGCYETLGEAKMVAGENIANAEHRVWHEVVDLMEWMK